ncbi:hypothetical protein TrCOL_g9366 [Triparma columacea]|uniref:Dihydrolipoamide acetyltransferase component of pyruvate dehydrogenase complex n=1 Tax=Triparma columacea TaxID=722753 RepID=A0A9W7FZL6_9STRA|nr:hypothetical protein TrCOL_g9366 [Triparma columacea]
MPALSSTMKEGRVVEWLKSEGDTIESGEAIATIESDKADMDLEAFEDGVLAKILVGDGEVAQVGSPIALVADSSDEVDSIIAAGVGGAPPAAAVTEDAAAPTAPASSSGAKAPDCDFEAVYMPALSSTMTEGKVVSWEIALGDSISAGEPMLTVESDKADMEVEHLGDDGFLAAIVVEEGGSASVGAPVALIASNEADIPVLEAYALTLSGAAPPPAQPAAVSSPSPSPAASAPSPTPKAAMAPPAGGRVVASPLAKKIASEMGIDLSTVSGSGPEGRITVSDVEAAAKGGGSKKEPAAGKAKNTWTPAPGVIAATPTAKALAKKNKIDLSTVSGTGNFGRVTVTDVKVAMGEKPAKKSTSSSSASQVELPSGVVPYTGMQRAVSNNMEATLSVPIFRVSRTIEMDAFNALYQSVKPNGVTLSALITKAVAVAVEKHPIMNAAHDPVTPGIKYNSEINIANAVALDGGLITPVLKYANEKSVQDLGDEWRELVGKAKAGTLKPSEFQSGTFAITNLGMFGVSAFDAILPPGTGTILALGGTKKVVVPDQKAVLGLKTVSQMEVTVTCDHRPIYGSDAALFLKTLANVME